MNTLKNIFLTVPLSLSLLGTGEAIVFGDKDSLGEAISYQPKGVYPLEVISNEIINKKKTMGTATVIKTREGVYGLTCAHVLRKNCPEDRLGLLLKTEKQAVSGETFSFANHSFIKNCTSHSNAEKKEATWAENSRYDIGLFTVSKKDLPNLTTFEGEIFDEPLISGATYEIRMKSFGPIFDNQLSFFKEPGKCYHEAPLKLTYDDEKGLYKKHTSRHFYLIFIRSSNDWDWHCDLLPQEGDVNSIGGDSGGIAVTPDGRLLAMMRGTDWKEFYEENKQLAEFMSEIKSHSDYYASKDGVNSLIARIHQEIADEIHTQKIELDESKFLYRFTLKEPHSSIVTYQIFTPLSIHKDFIEQYIKEHKWSCNPFLKKHQSYVELKESLRPLNDKQLRTLKEKEIGKRFLLLFKTNQLEEKVKEMDEKIIVPLTKASDPLLPAQERETYLIDINSQKAKFQQESLTLEAKQLDLERKQLKLEVEQLLNDYNCLQRLKEENEVLLTWFASNKNRLIEENRELTTDDLQCLKELENLVHQIKAVAAMKEPL